MKEKHSPMKLVTAVALAMVAIAPSAIAGSQLDYQVGMADARVTVGNLTFNIWLHRKRPTFLMEPSWATMLSGRKYADPVWRTVADAFVTPVGCGILVVRPLSRMSADWEATYNCPDGVNFLSLAKAQRKFLKRGEPLRFSTP